MDLYVFVYNWNVLISITVHIMLGFKHWHSLYRKSFFFQNILFVVLHKVFIIWDLLQCKISAISMLTASCQQRVYWKIKKDKRKMKCLCSCRQIISAKIICFNGCLQWTFVHCYWPISCIYKYCNYLPCANWKVELALVGFV